MNPLKKPKRNLKRKIGTATGIPTTKSGRKHKADKLEGQAILWLVIILFVIYLFSNRSEAATNLVPAAGFFQEQAFNKSKLAWTRLHRAPV